MKTLQQEVQKIMKQHAKNYDNGINGFIADLNEVGCENGLVGELLYYKDTIAFFKRHKQEINELLSELLIDVGGSIEEFFGKKWDKSDPLALNTQNQNLLAWFAFEAMAMKIATENENGGKHGNNY